MKKLKVLIGVLCYSLSGLVFAQLTLEQLQEELAIAESLVDELEGVYDQTDLALAEPLAQLAEQYTVRGRFDDAHRILDRATQIVRINEGLYTRSQLSYIQQKIENFAAARDWESAKQQMQHILWLHRTKSRVADGQLIEDLLHLSKMYLRGVNEDLAISQSYHLRLAMTVNWMALNVAESAYGTEDERLIPVIYQLLSQLHLQKVAVDRGGSLGYQLRQVFPGSDWVREKNEIRNYFYFTGRRLLNNIASIYSQPDARNEEALAMARLYIADWQVLFGRDAEALESYQQAYNGLKIVRPESADDYFSQPKVLPVPNFYPSIASAMARDPEFRNTEIADDSTAQSLSFKEWGFAFPYARKPYKEPAYESIDSMRALFSFSLAGVADVPLWLNTRQAQKFSVAMDTRLLDSETDSSDEQELLTQRMEWLSFRPKLVNGIPQAAEATIEYWAPREF